MTKDDFKEAATKTSQTLERGADWLSAAGIKSAYGWCIYAAFAVAGFVLGKWL